jgi:HD-GYP domain-containing protein (c-di-GMP phosphodiesterase class II)
VGELAAADIGLLRHGARVAGVAVPVGAALGLDHKRLLVLRRAALLHDVGKRHVPRDLLRKPGPLLRHERRALEAHAMFGGNILTTVGLLEEAIVVRHHHERWDGRGYPDALAGEDIPVESRIVLVADAFDAMTCGRPYRAAVTPAAALAEIDRSSGGQLDPDVVAAFADTLACEYAA